MTWRIFSNLVAAQNIGWLTGLLYLIGSGEAARARVVGAMTPADALILATFIFSNLIASARCAALEEVVRQAHTRP